ncbi:hypothetical protein KA089_00295, partial [Candidatus Woesebacteria bacterium]|nr:hypothetical protein [Candidatus Woesebacteria bacterium]
MIEEDLKTDYAPITLPELTEEQKNAGITDEYDLLNRAHTKDTRGLENPNIILPEEDDLISTKIANLDNADSYRREMSNATTRALLDSFKTRMEADASSNNDIDKEKSEFDIRTGGDLSLKEELNKEIEEKNTSLPSYQQEINKEEYRMQIVSAGTIGSLDHFLTQAINSEKDKKITPEHLIDLQALAEKQRVPIQEINKEEYRM